MKTYLEAQIAENDQKKAAHKSLDPVSAEYWGGRADAYRDILRRFCADDIIAELKKKNPGFRGYGIAGIHAETRKPCRIVCAAKSKKQAVKILETTAYSFGQFGAITDNAAEVKLALENPGKKIVIPE